MKLVFIHGWACDPSFWDSLSPLLADYDQERVNLGFFNENPNTNVPGEGNILIGHSLGFVHGVKNYPNWSGWIAINSFPRFITDKTHAGCVSAATLRAMRQQLKSNVSATINMFYELIHFNHNYTYDLLNIERLIFGLYELRDIDVGQDLKLQNVPRLILSSQNDPIVPSATSQAMESNKAKICWHPTAGHLLPLVDPVWCADHIRKFLNSNYKVAA